MKPIIGIPVKNDLESLKETITSIFESTNYFEKIIVVIGKNCNTQVIKFLEMLPRLEIHNIQAETPLIAYNYLFDYALKNKVDLFLTQTDVIFPKLYKRDWLQNMNQMAQNQQVGAVTSINGGGVSGPDYIEGFYWLGGWCVYYPLRILEKIGGFDSNFPNGMGVDIDHSYRLSKTGLKLVQMNYWVDHHMMNEREHDRNPNAEKDRKLSSQYFKKKWGLNG